MNWRLLMVDLFKKTDFINFSGLKTGELQVYTASNDSIKTKLIKELICFNDDIDLSNVIQTKKALNERQIKRLNK